MRSRYDARKLMNLFFVLQSSAREIFTSKLGREKIIRSERQSTANILGLKVPDKQLFHDWLKKAGVK